MRSVRPVRGWTAGGTARETMARCVAVQTSAGRLAGPMHVVPVAS